MANLNIRVDDDIKEQAFSVFAHHGISPSEAIRTFLAYVAQTGKMPMRQVIVSEEDAELVALVKQRLAEPEKIKITTLNELFA